MKLQSNDKHKNIHIYAHENEQPSSFQPRRGAFVPLYCHGGSSRLLCSKRTHKDCLNTTEMHQRHTVFAMRNCKATQRQHILLTVPRKWGCLAIDHDQRWTLSGCCADPCQAVTVRSTRPPLPTPANHKCFPSSLQHPHTRERRPARRVRLTSDTLGCPCHSGSPCIAPSPCRACTWSAELYLPRYGYDTEHSSSQSRCRRGIASL